MRSTTRRLQVTSLRASQTLTLVRYGKGYPRKNAGQSESPADQVVR